LAGAAAAVQLLGLRRLHTGRGADEAAVYLAASQ